MKKIFTLLFAAGIGSQLFAGGIVTNTNQSVMFTRLQARDATLGIDAAYFNPAGLTLLPNNGFFLSLSNQTLGQTKWLTSENPLFNTVPTEYEGKVSAPFFPSIYAAYKLDKLAFSFGFNPIGGGGGATFEDGLPSFEGMVAPVVLGTKQILAPIDVATGGIYGFTNFNGYSYDVFFEGTSVYFGYQLNASYQITEMLSIGIGGRFVSAKDTYNGYLRDIQVNAPTTYGGSMAPGTYVRTVGTLTGQSAALEPYAAMLDASTADIEVDVVEKGTGFTPIFSLNAKISDQLNVMVKYEHATKLELETEVKDGKNGGGMYTDGEKSRSDMPTQIAVGAMYKPLDKLMLSTGFHMYLDSKADYGRTKDDGSGNIVHVANSDILDNSIEFALGGEYSLSEKLDVSLGWLTTKTGAKESYQNDLSYSLNSNTIGGGLGFNLNEKIQINLGGSYTMYAPVDVQYDGMTTVGAATTYKETYDKDVWIVAVGVNFNFGAGK